MQLPDLVSLPYIGSLAWQSGLLRPTSSGLWLKAAYCGKASWDSPVNTPFIHNATALSAATYFTLQQLYTQLIAQLDTLIRQNNQSPKSACLP